MTCGTARDTEWLQAALGARFEVTTKVIGTGPGESHEERILGRVLRITEDGWELEADQRHAELVVRQLGLEGARPVTSPGEDVKEHLVNEYCEALSGSKATGYRAIAARINYLAADRAGVAFAAKEVCRFMANLTQGHLRALRRLGRYLVGVPRVVCRFCWPQWPGRLSMYSDSDWAGCSTTGKSTSGGVAMLGSHCLRAYSVTQKCVSLSSAEAELVALVKASTEAIGVCHLAETWGLSLHANVLVDSSAALAITQRRGCGKLRHVRIGHLWVQKAQATGEVMYRKALGTSNPADVCTKHLPAPRARPLLDAIGQVAATGEAAQQLQLRRLAVHRRAGEGLATRAIPEDPARDYKFRGGVTCRHELRRGERQIASHGSCVRPTCL